MDTDIHHQVPDHLFDCITVITMLFSALKHRIDYKPAPRGLNRIKAFFLFVRRRYTVPFLSLVIIHDHAVDIEANQQGVDQV